MSVSVRGPPIKVDAAKAFLNQGKDDLKGLIICNDDGMGDGRFS